MLEYRVEAHFECAMADVFAALVRELADGRWSCGEESSARPALPRAGLRFGYRQSRRLYSGEVLECLRPVSIVIVEQYCGPAVSISARQRWSVDPLDSASRLRGDLRIAANRFARLQMRFWKLHFAGRAQRTCSRVRLRLRTSERTNGREILPVGASAQSGTTGQKTGNTSMVSANTTSVSGKPILR